MLVLLFALICLAAAQPMQRNQLPKFPFLNQVGFAAQQEFQNIFSTRDLTRPQFEERIMRWAEKYNVKVRKQLFFP
ncbi:hypothetical protein OESDEN_07586 [Oesophagostomum dentatum]|uniref:SXP/RAL-2 family protein Ani s 5-like cation-binding domain-containing protein n=1 Tax=Oesophagostomum dentatum TaxID=61180 RepID=A0A0B1T5K4_OESDE|nr:hypothetical protein OESDEN_07586 [Oesophagostomum dentatum]